MRTGKLNWVPNANLIKAGSIAKELVKRFLIFLQKDDFSVKSSQISVFRPRLGGIGAVFQFPWEQQFNGEDQQEADARSCANFYDKVQESTEIQPFQQHEVGMVQEGEHKNIDGIGRPTHAPGGRLAVIEFRRVLGNKKVDHKRPDIGNEHAGGRMQSRRHGKIIQDQTCNKSHQQQPDPCDAEGQPEYKQKIQKGNNKPVEVRDLVQHKHLHQDKDGQPENIFNQIAQLPDFFC